MATTAKPNLTFNGKPITEADATKAIVAIYGEKRVEDIFKGLADGTYKCCSVAGGYLEVAKPEPAPAAQ